MYVLKIIWCIMIESLFVFYNIILRKWDKYYKYKML